MASNLLAMKMLGSQQALKALLQQPLGYQIQCVGASHLKQSHVFPSECESSLNANLVEIEENQISIGRTENMKLKDESQTPKAAAFGL